MKVIYLSRYNSYHQKLDLYEPGQDAFFTFGMGQFIAREFINRDTGSFEFENWRSDLRISDYMEREVEGLKCRVFPSKNLPFIGEFSFDLLKELKSLSRKEKVVIHVMSVHVPVMYLYVLLTSNSNLVATHLGGANPYWQLKERKSPIGRLKAYLFYQLEKKLFLRSFNHLITPCKDEADYFDLIGRPHSHMPIFGISREEIFNIQDRLEARKRLNLPLDKKVLLQVGRAIEARGFDWIMDLIDYYQEKPDYHLVFAGISEEDEYYGALKEKNLSIIPYLNHTNLPDFYNAADLLYYLPHGKMDLAFAGTSYVPLEAMLCGTPVVSTTFHHFRDPEVHEVSRIPRSYEEVIPMIEDLLNAEIPRERVREIVIRNYKWEVVLDKFSAIYKGSDA